ncbi:hypothetical protein JI749_14905 [Devosia oryziradicis]|uniref:HNH endonuclease n=1 Tax=Devosia oryziradicis TaxID=2801335 RepID=A0ABX7BX50_9HYPH|nr:hypothetical protein [Devosia oryziradicis]QQR35619.1 hypothetical protein JI749_14905 [Devosia oryziradicis]
MNRDWHETHRLPANAKLEQRIDWHIEHAAQCGCREIPDSVKKALEQRGIPVPPRRAEGR